MELDDGFQRRNRQRFASSDVPGHPGPAPGLDVEAQGRKGLDSEPARLLARRGNRRTDHARGPVTSIGCIARRISTFSSLNASAEELAGGSMARNAIVWSRWFWTTSRIAPTLS